MTILSRPFARLDRETQDRIIGGVVLGLAGIAAVIFVVWFVVALVLGSWQMIATMGGAVMGDRDQLPRRAQLSGWYDVPVPVRPSVLRRRREMIGEHEKIVARMIERDREQLERHDFPAFFLNHPRLQPMPKEDD